MEIRARLLPKLIGVFTLLGLLAACDRSTPSTPTSGINAFTGAWRSPTTATPAGSCTNMTWSITAVSATTATINYSATCAGVPVVGTANGALNGMTLNWTTTGTASNGCAFALSGTATPDTATDLRVTYSGTVCGLPVSGTEVLRR